MLRLHGQHLKPPNCFLALFLNFLLFLHLGFVEFFLPVFSLSVPCDKNVLLHKYN